jgi:hypothetical protein
MAHPIEGFYGAILAHTYVYTPTFISLTQPVDRVARYIHLKTEKREDRSE